MHTWMLINDVDLKSVREEADDIVHVTSSRQSEVEHLGLCILYWIWCANPENKQINNNAELAPSPSSHNY
jgi:hypothetical protein